MVDLFMICADLKNEQSALRRKSNTIIAKIWDSLNTPSIKTRCIIDGWKRDFTYIYGNIDTNLSSNNKLNQEQLFKKYNAFDIGKKETANALQLLFFAIQTYFSILIKLVMLRSLQGIRYKNGFSYTDIILGRFAQIYKIKNYCVEDWYCWPVFELENGFDSIMNEINLAINEYVSDIPVEEFQLNNNYDYIKQIYEAIIPKELRHALGEYYTPDWLAEATLRSALVEVSTKNVSDITIIDPTCGSGTFLFKAIEFKRRSGTNLDGIISTVLGIDINPLAVLTAKTNYLLSVLDLIDGSSSIIIPVYNADIIKLANANTPTCCNCETELDFLLAKDPIKIINYRSMVDANAARSIRAADIVVGNPPWVNWEYLPENYKTESQQLWIEYKLFNAKGRDLSFSKEDISVLITYIVMDKLLKENGIIGFVIRQGVFKSAQNGVGFRRFIIRDEMPIKVIKVEDLSQIRAFENASNSAALFFAKKGKINEYPVPYFVWKKRKDIKKSSFGAYSQLKEVLSQLSICELCATPATNNDNTSLWLTTSKGNLHEMKRVLGSNDYRARTGVFTGGANAVYWISIRGKVENNILVENIVERAKRKTQQIQAKIEPDYVYPMLKGCGVKKWNTSYDSYLLCPHTVETKMWPISKKQLMICAPKTLAYLNYFKDDLDGRNGFAGWEKEIQKQEFHAILRVGEYTFAKYKVIWKYIASEFVCAVISTVNDKYLGKKLLLPNEKIMYISTDSEYEAYYLCGILSSTIIAECVKSYMNPTSISAHVLNKLNIPRYDKDNILHSKIAYICKEGHGKNEITSYIEEIDKCVCQLL